MKTLFGILFLTLFCVLTTAQNPVTSTHTLTHDLITSGDYFSWSGGDSNIKGSPYLTEEFLSGMVYWNQLWNEGIDLRYNIYQGKFEVKHENGIIVIDPIKNKIDTLKYSEEVFVKKYLELDNEMLVVYLSLLGQQNGYGLYKRYRIKLTEAVTDTDLYNKAKPAEYKRLSPVYYVFRGNEHWSVKGNKILADIFQIDTKVLKKYLKENKYSLSREEDLLEAVLYFSSSSF